MGIYIKGAFGAFSGKVGNLVGSNWRSITYMRSLPKRSSKPATEKQKAQREKFALAVSFLSPLRDLINVGYSDKSRTTMTAFNKAMDDLLANIEGVYPDYSIPYDKVQFSKGRVATVQMTQDVSAGTINLQWKNRSSVSAKADDQVILVFYNEGLDDFFVIQEATRSEENYQLQPGELPDGDYQFWSLVSNDKGQCSKTLYQGSFTL
jgi:hypothetical protein